MLVLGNPEQGKWRRRGGEEAGVTSNRSFPPRIWEKSPPLVLEYSLEIDNKKKDGMEEPWAELKRIKCPVEHFQEIYPALIWPLERNQPPFWSLLIHQDYTSLSDQFDRMEQSINWWSLHHINPIIMIRASGKRDLVPNWPKCWRWRALGRTG